MYLLSDLRLTDSKIEYVLDLIQVYFSVESTSLPSLQVGVHKRSGTQSRVITQDLISADLTKFITLMGSQGVKISLVSIIVDKDQYLVTLKYEGEEINFTLS